MYFTVFSGIWWQRGEFSRVWNKQKVKTFSGIWHEARKVLADWCVPPFPSMFYNCRKRFHAIKYRPTDTVITEQRTNDMRLWVRVLRKGEGKKKINRKGRTSCVINVFTYMLRCVCSLILTQYSLRCYILVAMATVTPSRGDESD